MCKPIDLPEMIATSYQLETSSLLSVVKKEMQQRKKMNQSNPQDTSRSYLSYHPSAGWKQKQSIQSMLPSSIQSKQS